MPKLPYLLSLLAATLLWGCQRASESSRGPSASRSEITSTVHKPVSTESAAADLPVEMEINLVVPEAPERVRQPAPPPAQTSP